jgi:pyrroline-5-carboxylate reductase
MAKTFTLAVIGAGNMGGALVNGVVSAGALAPGKIVVADADQSRSAALSKESGVQSAKTNTEAARDSEYVVLAVKPGVIRPVIEEIAGVMTEEQTLVSLAAGVPLSRMREPLGAARPALVRVMPNTPALVGAGMFAVAAPGVPPGRVAKLKDLLGAAGDVVEVAEGMMDAVTGLSGSGPAFVFVMIEALADGGVAAGLPRAVANRLAVQTVEGAARMVRETGEHPGALKDAVASPGGTTIAGLAELERAGFRAAAASAVRAAAKRARELSEEK